MLALHGTGVSEGISLGKAHVLRRKRLDTREYVIPESLLEEEVTRFTRAIELARTQLEQVRIHIPAGAPAETASFIDTHLLILSDPMISEAPIDFIRTARRNAEWAHARRGKPRRKSASPPPRLPGRRKRNPVLPRPERPGKRRPSSVR